MQCWYYVQEFTFKDQISNKWLDVSDASRTNEKPAHLASNSQSELGNVREFLMLSQKCIWCLVINVAYTLNWYYSKELCIVSSNGIFHWSFFKSFILFLLTDMVEKIIVGYIFIFNLIFSITSTIWYSLGASTTHVKYKLFCRLTIFPQFSYQGQDHKSFNLSTIRWRQRRNFPIYQFSMKLQSAGSLLIAGRRQGVFSGTSFFCIVYNKCNIKKNNFLLILSYINVQKIPSLWYSRYTSDVFDIYQGHDCNYHDFINPVNDWTIAKLYSKCPNQNKKCQSKLSFLKTHKGNFCIKW